MQLEGSLAQRRREEEFDEERAMRVCRRGPAASFVRVCRGKEGGEGEDKRGKETSLQKDDGK